MKPMVLPKGYDARGADMGRNDTITEPDYPVVFRLQRLQWVDGDYDEGGAYWGRTPGEHIYWARGDGAEEVQELFVRARCRAEAKQLVRAKFKNCRILY